MKKVMTYIVALAATCALMTSCSVTTPVCATNNNLGTKSGEVSQQFVLCFAWNKSGGVQEAAKNAGITKISHVEIQDQPLFPIIGKRKIIVYGE